jgi:hypothetical protein
VTEYEIREVGRHQWLVFADRQSIALCADEDEAVKAMTDHSARNRQSGPLWTAVQSRTRRRKPAVEAAPQARMASP